MAHNVLSYGSPEAARRANRAINKIAQDGGFVGVKPTERRVHTAVASQAAAIQSSEYNGYFKIVDSSIVNEDGTKTYRVRVVDGNTYDPDTQLSGPSVLHFNGEYKNIVPYEADVIPGYLNFIYIRCSVSGCNIFISTSSLQDSDVTLVRLIGTVSLDSNQEIKIRQEFTDGIFYVMPKIYTGAFSSYHEYLSNELVVTGGYVQAGDKEVFIETKRFQIKDNDNTSIFIKVYNDSGELKGGLTDTVTDTQTTWYQAVVRYYKDSNCVDGLQIVQSVTFGTYIRINDRWL